MNTILNTFVVDIKFGDVPVYKQVRKHLRKLSNVSYKRCRRSKPAAESVNLENGSN